MKTIYLAGPIAGCTDKQANGWRQQVKDALGGTYQFHDPMDRDFRGQELDDHGVRDLVQGDKRDISTSDIVLVLATKATWGTAMEIALATMVYHKPVVAVVGVMDVQLVSPWLRFHAFRMFWSLENAIDFLKVVESGEWSVDFAPVRERTRDHWIV